MQFSLYKIFFYFKALLWESILHLSLRYCCTNARPLRNIRPPTDPHLYAIHHTLLLMAISCDADTYDSDADAAACGSDEL